MREIDLHGQPVLDDYVSTLRTMSATMDPKQIQRLFTTSARRLNRSIGYISVSKRNMPPGHYKITRQILSDEDAESSSYNPWQHWNDLASHTGGIIGDLIAEPRPRLIHHLRLRGDPVLGDALFGFGSLAAVPLFEDGEDLNWSIMVGHGDEGITIRQLEEFFMRANLGGRMTKGLIDKKRVEELLAERQRQLLDIANIQRNLLPERVPHKPGIAIATSYLPCNESGGDYYDFFEFPDGRLGLFIADVSGHGAGAATVMAMLQTILHEAHARGLEDEPARLLWHANAAIGRRRIDGGFVTAFMGVLSEDHRTMVYANAGHNRPILRRGPNVHGKGRVIPIEGGLSFPLGVVPDTEFEQAEMRLETSDSIVLYTDGITEARSRGTEREMFGEHRLHATIEACSGEPECVIDSIHTELFQHTNARDREDDQTIVAVRLGER